MKTTLFNKLIFGVFAVMLMFSASMPVLAAPNTVKHQSVPKTNAKIELNKVKYLKLYGHTYALFSGYAKDPDTKNTPLEVSISFDSSKTNQDNQLFWVTTDNKGYFWQQYFVPSDGKITAYVKDVQTAELVQSKTVSVKQSY